MMKRLCAVGLLLLSLLLVYGCSSIPAGTDKITDLLKNGAGRLGQNVTVVGLAETKTPMTSFRMFKIYQGGEFIWVKLPEGVEEPPQGMNVRVAGVLKEDEFTVIGKVFYIDASSVRME